MTDRKKKIRIIQISCLILGLLIVFFTYSQKDQNSENAIISKKTQKKINESFIKNNEEGDIFYDVSYSGIDLSGNRYIIKSKEAKNNEKKIEIVFMKGVEAFFYFKDGTILKIQSKTGIYNNKTLDMKFAKSVKAFYEGSTLVAEKAEYLNSENSLTISEKVAVKDLRGEVFADKLFFDLKKQTLNIKSFKNNKVNANLNYNEKKF
tara:strand:+ start:96 stop:713 length:618 start_codon:yes stop_codon:yes gene_type:complete